MFTNKNDSKLDHTKVRQLITTDCWFYAPDGRSYKAVWGTVEVFSDKDVLGIQTNARSANWYVRVGKEGNAVTIAGCQIHYAVDCPNKPNTEPALDYVEKDGKFETSLRPCNIYIAE